MIVYVQDEKLEIPVWVVDHTSFLEWIRSGSVPDSLRVGYIHSHVWIDTMSERAFAHNQLKYWIAVVLMRLIDENGLGVFFGDGMMFTSETEQFSTVPEGIFATQATLDEGRVRLTGGRDSQKDTEVVGTPDLMIEVVSDNSEEKDTEWLVSKYWDAGIREYWVVDGRTNPLRFTIYRHRSQGYMAVRKQGGWLRSEVLGKAFRFVRGPEQLGFKTYRFEVK